MLMWKLAFLPWLFSLCSSLGNIMLLLSLLFCLVAPLIGGHAHASACSTEMLQDPSHAAHMLLLLAARLA